MKDWSILILSNGKSRRYARRAMRYASDLTDREWGLISPCLLHPLMFIRNLVSGTINAAPPIRSKRFRYDKRDDRRKPEDHRHQDRSETRRRRGWWPEAPGKSSFETEIVRQRPKPASKQSIEARESGDDLRYRGGQRQDFCPGTA
ncbi:hypothetical protein F4V90_25035 [Neorhizobium galegae]|nr:hypothetical protein F4V90_25035 [Neorhizobium galegae]